MNEVLFLCPPHLSVIKICLKMRMLQNEGHDFIDITYKMPLLKKVKGNNCFPVNFV